MRGRVSGSVHEADDGARVAFTRELAAPVERVWAMLADPDARARWLFAGTIEARVGGVVSLHDADHVVSGRVLEWSPPYALALEWSSPDAPRGVVRISLAETPTGGCRLRLEHRLVSGRPRSLAAGWHALLDRLAVDLGEMAADDPWTFARLVERYAEEA